MYTSTPLVEMSFPTRMVAGPGARARIPELLREFDVSRVLVVSDSGLQKAGIVSQVAEVLSSSALTHRVWLGVSAHASEREVKAGAQAFREMSADGVIGLGGGSAMDVAKLIALKSTHPLSLTEYDDTRGGADRIGSDIPPVIAVPTTAGTGSEVGRAGVVVTEDEPRKMVVFSPHLMPKAAVLDAELTVGLPPSVTAATGMDALTHALEAYVARGEHPFADLFALGALSRVGVHLLRAVHSGADLVARHEMLLAASMGAVAFQKGLGACHALAHPLSAVCGVHHGLANAIMLPHVVRFNLPVAYVRYARVARALGWTEPGSEEAQAFGCRQRLLDLASRCGLPDRLAPLGVQPDQVETMAQQAIVDPCAEGNPRLFDFEDAEALYRAAL